MIFSGKYACVQKIKIKMDSSLDSDLENLAKDLEWRLEPVEDGKITSQEIRAMTDKPKKDVKTPMKYFEKKYRSVKLVTNVSGHGGNKSSPNYVWEGLSLLPMSSLLDRVDEIVINGILRRITLRGNC